MTHELITLPYAADALAPVISKETVEFHHGKHLLAYVNTLNSLIPGTEFENADLLDIVRKSEGKLFNQAGQVLNHNLYFTQFGPNAGGAPKGALADAIAKEWGSFEAFQAAFLEACTGLFGSGWVWLASDENGVLTIEKEPNAGNPIRKGLNPLLGFDVWEHSYYLSYQNRRADHIKDLWSIVRWDVVEERYNK
nr:superoxide dismutase [uncultured Porphyromonas sp.]